ncbi:MAG: HAD-IIB family hydrolase [Pseudomonadota bacterium]
MPHASPPSILVFSDLDGTVLDHQTYDWAAARPGLDHLRAIGAGLVLASSKTAAEMEPIRLAMGWSDWPAIVENGSGTIPPDTASDALATGESRGSVYADLLSRLKQAPRGFIGFSDMSVQEVADATGLALGEAALARQRQFSEPGLWTGPAAGLTEFLAALKPLGLTARRGGRFLTISVVGAHGGTKADAMAKIVAHYGPKMTIALGDAPNDIEMLEAADYGIIITNPHGPTIKPLEGERSGRIRRSLKPGPAGWSEAIIKLTSVASQTQLPEHGKGGVNLAGRA